jgi:hypothetical protein
MVKTVLIHEVVKAIRGLKLDFILIGGAAAIWLESTRETDDVDILIDPGISLTTLPTVDRLIIGESNMWYKTGRIFNVKIDVLRNIFEENYQTLSLNTMTVNDVKVLTPEYALAMKVLCLHNRGGDYDDELKCYSDRDDILFYCHIMRTEGSSISEQCANRFQIGAYRMAYLRMWMTDEPFQALRAVGIHQLLIPWSKDTDSQKELYSLLTDGTDPLTDSLPED